MGQYDRSYYGGATDIALAKQSGLQGNFYDVSGYGEGSKYQDLLHSYQTGGNPVILGGAGATNGINDALYNQLSSAGANIQRIGGADRYQVQDNFRNYANNLNQQSLMQQGKDQVNSLYDAQKNSQLSDLKAQQNKSLGQLTPQYQGLRNQADVTNQQDVNRLRELMAANGLNATGENLTASAALSSQRQNSLNQLNTQQQQQINDINDPAKAQAITSQLEAQRAQALLSAQNNAQDKAYQMSRDSLGDAHYNAQQAYQQQQAAAQQAWQKYIYDNLSADQKAQLASGKYSIDSTNAANSSASQAELAYYKSLGFNQGQGGSGYTKPVSGNYSKEINNAAKAHGIDANLVRAVAQQESSLGAASSNVMQVNGMNGKGALASINSGTQMLSGLLKKTGGNIQEALAAYNMGSGILSYFKSHGGYSVANMQGFSNMQKQKNGYKVYGDPNYVEHVMRYYG